MVETGEDIQELAESRTRMADAEPQFLVPATLVEVLVAPTLAVVVVPTKRLVVGSSENTIFGQ